MEAGVHFGHRVSRWNPKMAPYIFGRRNLIHIINLSETVKGLIRAYYFLKKLTAEGQTVLFVGTKRQAKLVIRKEAERGRMPYVAERWLGGTLTNFSTIHTRLARLEELERMEKDGSIDSMGKKMASTLRRERRKIARNLEGIRQMEKLPGAIIIVDPQKEHLAVHEAAKLNIPTIALMDTDSDPDMIDIPIPGNDDAMRSIEIIFGKLTDAIVAGQAEWEDKQKLDAKRRQEFAPRQGEEVRRHDNRGRDRRDQRPTQSKDGSSSAPTNTRTEQAAPRTGEQQGERTNKGGGNRQAPKGRGGQQQRSGQGNFRHSGNRPAGRGNYDKGVPPNRAPKSEGENAPTTTPTAPADPNPPQNNQ